MLTDKIPPAPSQAETDIVLAAINEKLSTKTFDPNNHQLMKQMVESFADSRGMVRLGLAEAFGVIGDTASPFLLQGLANHPNPVVRRACAKSLTLIGDLKAIPTLLHAFLNDEDTVVQGSSVAALAKTGEASASALLEILASPEHPESTKGHAAWALAFIGAKAKQQLYEAFSSDDPEVRAAVVGAIANIAEELQEEQAFNILINALTDNTSAVRIEAAAALGKINYQPALINLIELLNHTEGESRKAAALALMKMGDRTTLEPLQTALTQETEEAIKPVLKLAIAQIDKTSNNP